MSLSRRVPHLAWVTRLPTRSGDLEQGGSPAFSGEWGVLRGEWGIEAQEAEEVQEVEEAEETRQCETEEEVKWEAQQCRHCEV